MVFPSVPSHSSSFTFPFTFTSTFPFYFSTNPTPTSYSESYPPLTTPATSSTPVWSTPSTTPSSSDTPTFSPSTTTPTPAYSTPSSSSSSTSTASSTSASAPSSSVQPSSSLAPTSIVAGAVVPIPDASSSVPVLSSSTATPSSTSSHSSSSGFLSDTGAVAGTFTVVGLVAIAGVIAVAFLVAKRRHSKSYDEDAEHLEKTPDLSPDRITNSTSLDNTSNSDHVRYGAHPIPLSTPPTLYYPDHAYALHPQAFQAESFSHPGYTQQHPPQPIYSPDQYHTPYPPGHVMPNPHGSPNLLLDSPPVPPPKSVLPSALRPSVKSAATTPNQSATNRFSIDSFYSPAVTENPISTGQAF